MDPKKRDPIFKNVLGEDAFSAPEILSLSIMFPKMSTTGLQTRFWLKVLLNAVIFDATSLATMILVYVR